MTDHYELFGVEPGASKDEIKAAYRSEVENADSSRRAELNRAWNVLSDPIQRQRYDETLGAAGAGDDIEVTEGDGEDVASVPARRATGARRGPESKVLEADAAATNGAGKNGSGKGGSGGGSGGSSGGGGSDNGDDRPLGRTPPEPTVVLPEGMHLAAKKQRGFSILFDLSILAVLYVLFVSVLIPMVLKDQFPKEVDRLDAISTQKDKLDKQKSKAEDLVDKFNDQAAAAKKDGDENAENSAKDSAKQTQLIVDQREKDIKKLQDESSDLQGKLIGTTYLMLGGLLVLCLLYLVPSTALTGQTLGKRLRKVWLVRLDGSKVGWGGAFAHSAVPVVIALAIPQLGPIVALGIVFWSLRDRNEQGVHDKLAKTLVVDAPPAALAE